MRGVALFGLGLCALPAAAFAGVGLQGFSMSPAGLSNAVFTTIGARTTPDGSHTAWPVAVNLAGLAALPASVSLNLPDRSTVVLNKLRAESRGPGAFLWTGSGGGCSALFSAAPFNFRGVVSCPNAAYGVESAGVGSSSLNLLRLDPSPTATSGPVDVVAQATSTVLPAGSATTTPCGTAIPTSDTAIEMLVLYDESVRLALDSGSNTFNTVKFAHDAVDTTQLAMDASTSNFDKGGVEPIARVAFLGAQEVSRADSGDSHLDLDWITNSSEAKNFRKFYGADSVIYLVENAGTSIGVTKEPYYNGATPRPGPDYAPYAMSVIQRNKALNDTSGLTLNNQEPYIFQHEFGHQFGANHNPDVGDNSTPLEPDAFAKWQAYAATEGGGMRTLLSYRDPNCTHPCTRILHYSNPDVPEDWFITGSVGYQNNARVIQKYAHTTAQYCASLGRIFANSFDDRYHRP